MLALVQPGELLTVVPKAAVPPVMIVALATSLKAMAGANVWVSVPVAFSVPLHVVVTTSPGGPPDITTLKLLTGICSDAIYVARISPFERVVSLGAEIVNEPSPVKGFTIGPGYCPSAKL